MVFYFYAFHILTADIQDTVYLRIKEGRCVVVGYCLHFPFIQKESSFYQCLPVSGGAGVRNFRLTGQMAVDFLNGTDTGSQGIAVIVAVKGIEQGAVFPHQCSFCCCGAGVNAQIAVSAVTGNVTGYYIVMALPLIEFIIIFLSGEQRLHTVYFKFHMYVG